MDRLAKGVSTRKASTAETDVNLTGWEHGAAVSMLVWTGMKLFSGIVIAWEATVIIPTDFDPRIIAGFQ